MPDPMEDGNQYWNWDPAQNKWVPDPVTNPNGAHAPEGQNAPPPPGANTTPPPQMPNWAELGLAGGTGTDWWLASMMENMVTNPEVYGVGPGVFDDDFFRDFISSWNEMEQEERQHFTQYDAHNGFQGFQNAAADWEARTITPEDEEEEEIIPPPETNQNRNAGQDALRESLGQGGNADPAMREFYEAMNAWREGGRVGPMPKLSDFDGSGGDDGTSAKPGLGDGPIQTPQTQMLSGQQGGLKTPGGGARVLTKPGGSGQTGATPPADPGIGTGNPNQGQKTPATSMTQASLPQTSNSLSGQRATYGGNPQQKKFQKKYPAPGTTGAI